MKTASALVLSLAFASGAIANEGELKKDSAAPVVATSPVPQNDINSGYPPALETLVSGGAGEVVIEFDAGNDMTGYGFRPNGSHDTQMFYRLNNSQRLFIGTLVDEKGRNLTEAHKTLVPPMDYSQAFEKLKEAAMVSTGTGGHQVYVVYEPYCGYCQKLHQDLVKRGGSEQVNWLPVAFLSGDSWKVGAAWLEAENGEAFLNGIQSKEGRTAALSIPANPNLKSVVENNWNIAGQFGISGTPALVYKDKEGVVRVHRGVMDIKGLDSLFSIAATE